MAASKILDFGLARLQASRRDASDIEDAPTQQLGTQPVAVMGTAGYMSPEQVRGQTVDPRSAVVGPRAPGTRWVARKRRRRSSGNLHDIAGDGRVLLARENDVVSHGHGKGR